MSEAIAERFSLSARSLQLIGGMPLLLEVDAEGLGAADWARHHHGAIQAILQERGAVLLRGLDLPDGAGFGQVLSALFGGELIEYVYRSTPRTEVQGRVYTATEYPAGEVIPQHNENAYARSWPLRIGFLCVQPAERGGETPIGNSRAVYRAIPAAIREKFERKGVMYVRNYSQLDLPWSEVFQTDDRGEVETYCRDNELEWEWLDDDGLRTRQVNPATALHPVTGETLWFNQAHLFHVSNLDPEVAATMIELFGEENLPRNAYYGDGSPIEPEALQAIRDIYRSTRLVFPWQRNDLLLLDNMLFTHGRESYGGARKVLTGMACPNR
ncbi:TauD/TfdA family dioxygenase [Dyella mobilis]|nr:TauD/TfdA family dioxygenase [Dyella mobilis]UDM84286.1 dioxygenase [Dyella mobilis]